MAKKFETLFRKLPEGVQKRTEARAQKEFEALPLAELREAQDLTQVELARKLGVDQGAVSKIEHRTDMYLSTLSDVIRAMGGTLQLRATFPSGDVRIVTLQGSASGERQRIIARKRR
jgi:DNA-binding XRE family transcriptional regulator